MNIAMIYMASGFGRRFGANKLLAPFQGTPLYLHGLKRLLEAAGELESAGEPDASKAPPPATPIHVQVLVVTQYTEILQSAAALGVKAVYNPDSIQGITASLKLGTRQAGENTDLYLYFVADEPYITAGTIVRFVRGFLESGKGMGCVKSGDRPASPSIFRKTYRKALLSLEGDRGGRQLMKANPEDVWMMEAPARELMDIDVPGDFTSDKNGK